MYLYVSMCVCVDMYATYRKAKERIGQEWHGMQGKKMECNGKE